MEENQFTTSEGVVIPLRRVSRVYVARIHAKYPIPETPTYTATIIGGGEQTFPHDETTLETAEDHKMWNEYNKAHEIAVNDRLEKTTEFLLYQCVDMDPPPLDQWSIDFGMWDIDPPDPDDKLKYKVAWIDDLMPNRDDYAGLMVLLYSMAGVIEPDMVEEYEKFFRLALGRLAASG